MVSTLHPFVVAAGEAVRFDQAVDWA